MAIFFSFKTAKLKFLDSVALLLNSKTNVTSPSLKEAEHQ
jgi:hypothetical protein